MIEGVCGDGICSDGEAYYQTCNEDCPVKIQRTAGISIPASSEDLSNKDKFAKLTVFFSLLQYFIFFLDQKIDFKKDLTSNERGLKTKVKIVFSQRINICY